MMDHDKATTTLHQVMADPDYLDGLKVIQAMIKKPEFLFMNKYYYLLHNSIIPNCRITLPILHQYYNISRDVEDYIVTGTTAKVCIQRLLNFLLVSLDNEKDYMKFCVVINSISVMTNLPYGMIAEFQTNGHWKQVAVHPKLIPCKSQPHQHFILERSGAKNYNNKDKSCLSNLMELDDSFCDSHNQDWVDYKETHCSSAASAAHCSDKRRELSVSNSKSRPHMSMIQRRFSELVEMLPSNCYSTVCKLRRMTNFTDVDEKMSDTLSECDDARVFNNQLLSYIINKCAGDVLLLCDVLKNVVSTNRKKQLQDLASCILQTVTVAPVSPVVTIVHEKNEQSTSFISSSTSCVSTSEDHHVHICSTTISNDTSLSTTEPKRSTDNNTTGTCHTTNSTAKSPNMKQLLSSDKSNASGLNNNPTSSVQDKKESTTSSDKILCTSVDVLCSQNLLTYDEAVDICLADYQTRMKLLNDKLTTMSPKLPSNTSTINVANTDVPGIQQCVDLSTGFSILKSKYQKILKYFPKDFYQSLQKLQDKLKDDQLCNILKCSDSNAGNKMILDYLIDAIKSEDDLLNLYELLDRLTDVSPNLKHLINELRKGNKTPELSDLCKNVVPIYAARWRDLGTELKIPNHHLNIIQANNANHPSHSERCCREMLVRWMQITPKPTWNELQKAIDDLPLISHDGSSNRVKYLQPPSLPANHVDRQVLLDEIATKLLQATNDPKKYETTLTITGAGGFGKTIIATSLCYHSDIAKQFTNGFVFIELGPQATDPSVKMSQLYHLLTGEKLEHCDINHAEQEIKQVTSNHYCNLLVIIDDVWYVEDAEPLVKAFSNCKTILTSRMNDIEQYIPSKQRVVIGPMKEHEAISLLTSGVIDSQLSQEDVSLLSELAKDVYLWPLLLSLIRGQICHYLKQYHLPYHNAIQKVQAKLHHKGLTAFDKSRKFAVEVCIKMTLELLTESLSDKIKILILYNGIGISIQTALLKSLWGISEQEAENILDILWAYSLVQFAEAIFPNNIKQHCVEVHAVISQYIIESMDSNKAHSLSVWGGKVNITRSVTKGLKHILIQSHGYNSLDDIRSLSSVDYLKFKLSEIENILMPFYVHTINTKTAFDPHKLILILQETQDYLKNSSCTVNLLFLLDKELNSLIANCKEMLHCTHKLCRELNQKVQKILYEKKYDKLLQTVELFIKNYPLFDITRKTMTMIEKVIPYCGGELLQSMMMLYEHLHIDTHDYHHMTLITLPYIKLHIELYEQITSSLLNGSPDIEQTDNYFMYGKFDEDLELVRTNRLIKLQEVAPNYVQRQVSQ